MTATACTQPGCTGTIEDGYCAVCGMAPTSGPPAGSQQAAQPSGYAPPSYGAPGGTAATAPGWGPAALRYSAPAPYGASSSIRSGSGSVSGASAGSGSSAGTGSGRGSGSSSSPHQARQPVIQRAAVKPGHARRWPGGCPAGPGPRPRHRGAGQP